MEMAIRASKQEILSKYGDAVLSFVRERGRGLYWYSVVVGEYQLTANMGFPDKATLPIQERILARELIERGENFSIVKKDTGAFLYVQTRS